jgi:TonB family protein
MSSAETWKTWEGRVVDGKFPLRQWLGGSDHGAVFLTEHPGEPSQKAALKLIPADAGDADRQLVRWRAAAQLSHPHLIRILETGRCGMTLLYVVMEFADEDLSQILPQRALAPPEVADMLPALLETIAYLHGAGFVHRRIKPSNILAVGELLKLSSDQIAAPGDSGGPRRERDAYDAPETASGNVSAAGDSWSLGATLVTALTQSPPVVEAGSESDPRIPATIAEPFRGIARECLHLDPKRRGSIAEIQARLHTGAGRSVPAGPEPVLTKKSESSSPYRYSRRMLIPIAVLVAVGLGWRIFHKSSSEPTEDKPVNIVAPAEPAPAAKPAPTAPPKPAPAAATAAPYSKGGVVRQVLPDIPRSAMNTINGTIKIAVRVDVDSSGKVTGTKLTSAGPSKYFAGQVVQAARRWEFSAPVVNGQPTTSAWVLRFRLKRSGVQVAPEKASR